ncbi:MAG: hypothetical protein QM679_07570 [Patulibacter sp.]
MFAVSLLIGATRAQAAVSYVSASSASGSVDSAKKLTLSFTKPSNLQVGDLMLAAIQWIPDGTVDSITCPDSDTDSTSGDTDNPTTPAGTTWHNVVDCRYDTSSSGHSWAEKVWYTFATASDVSSTASYEFTGNWSPKGGATAAGTISVYRGVNTTTPIRGSVSVNISSDFTSGLVRNNSNGLVLPNSSNITSYTDAVGSLGISVVMALRGTGTGQFTFILSNGTWADKGYYGGVQGDMSTGSSRENINTAVAFLAPMTSGAFPSPTPTEYAYTHMQSSAGNVLGWTAYSFVLNPANTNACFNGSSALTTSPSTITFDGTALDGTNKSISGSASYTINDQSAVYPTSPSVSATPSPLPSQSPIPADTTTGATSSGWKIQLNATQFQRDASHTLATTALAAASPTVSAGTGQCASSSDGGGVASYPVSLTAGSTATVYSNAANYGIGPTTVAIPFTLAVPANIYAGTYTSTWTTTLASGP